MKKLLSVCVMALLLTSCRRKLDEAPTTYQSWNGDYHLYETQDKVDYLDFLEKFDESEYTIVDISIVNFENESASGYIVTYKDN
jgi:hypothetical protein